jgi:hypothetical protein
VAQTRLGRAVLETLHVMGEPGTHHRVGTRRDFDLVERLLPAELLSSPDPNPTDESCQDWHVLRRVGALGLAVPQGSAEVWLGILGTRSEARRAALSPLDPAFDKAARRLVITSWWWDEGIEPDQGIQEALAECPRTFLLYLGIAGCRLGGTLHGIPGMGWVGGV